MIIVFARLVYQSFMITVQHVIILIAYLVIPVMT